MVPRKNVVSETNVASGLPASSPSAYDLHLIEESDGNYTLQVSMKLQFHFENKYCRMDDVYGSFTWPLESKNLFMEKWKAQVMSKWDGHTLRRLPSGKTIKLQLQLDAGLAHSEHDHWDIYVRKMEEIQCTSYVQPKKESVYLDSGDLFKRKRIKNGRNYFQRAGVHEFGHMLGFRDEYRQGKFISDRPSIMNNGEVLKPRHLKSFDAWLDKQLKNKNIK